MIDPTPVIGSLIDTHRYTEAAAPVLLTGLALVGALVVLGVLALVAIAYIRQSLE